MKKLSYVIFIVLTFICCGSPKERILEKEVSSKDFIKYRNDDDFKIIELDSFKNFSELRKKMGRLACDGKVPGLKFKYKSRTYNSIGFSECPDFNGVADYFRRNLIIIKNDSLVTLLENKIKKEPINNLQAKLEKIALSPSNFQYGKKILKPALIHLYIDDKYPISTTKKVLKEVIKQFKNINSKEELDYFKYSILFEGAPYILIPPPPIPPSSQETFEYIKGN